MISVNISLTYVLIAFIAMHISMLLMKDIPDTNPEMT